MVEHTNPFPEEQGQTPVEGSSAETTPIHKSGEFQLHIPEEELQFGDEDSIQSYSDSFQKKEEPKNKKPVERKQRR